MFHVFMLQKCIGDPSSITQFEDSYIAEDLSYDKVPVVILYQQVRKLQTKKVASVKVLWQNNNIDKSNLGSRRENDEEISRLFTT